MVQTASLRLSPWAAEALSLDEEREIAKRAVDLHCRIGVTNSHREWTIGVSSWAKDEITRNPIHRINRHHQRGHLAELIQMCLDEYERAYVFTGEELLSIQGAA